MKRTTKTNSIKKTYVALVCIFVVFVYSSDVRCPPLFKDQPVCVCRRGNKTCKDVANGKTQLDSSSLTSVVLYRPLHASGIDPGGGSKATVGLGILQRYEVFKFS